MFGVNLTYLASFSIGAFLGTYLFSLLFRYALLGRSGTKLHSFGVVLLLGVVAVGMAAFGSGTDGFQNRITNSPDMVHVIAYPLSALIIGLLFWWRTDDTPSTPVEPQICTRSAKIECGTQRLNRLLN